MAAVLSVRTQEFNSSHRGSLLDTPSRRGGNCEIILYRYWGAEDIIFLQ